MIKLKINDSQADLPSSVSISLEYNTPLFLTGDDDVISGSFAVAINLPPTGKNRRLLSYIDSLDLYETKKEISKAELYYDNTLIFAGVAEVSQMSSGNIVTKIYDGVGALSELKTEYLDDMTKTYTDPTFLASLITASTTSDFDYVCFPTANNTTENNVVNWWKLTPYTGAAGIDPLHAPVVPYFRATRLLTEIFTAKNYNYQSRFLNSDELNRLCILNNYALTDDGGSFPVTEIQRTNHLPHITKATFIKRLARLFNLGVFVNSFRKRIDIKPAQDLLTSFEVIDWSEKVQTINGQEFITAPSYFSFQDENLEPIDTDYQVSHGGGLPVGTLGELALVRNKMQYFKYINEGSGDMWKYLQDAPLEAGDADADATLTLPTKVPRMTELYYNKNNGDTALALFHGTNDPNAGSFFDRVVVPAYDVELKRPDNMEQAKDNDLRLVFYRGMQASEDDTYPLASIKDSTVNGAKIGDAYHLAWQDTGGLYANHWQQWQTFLSTSRLVTVTVKLTLYDLLTLDMSKKISIFIPRDGKKYNFLIKQIKINISNRGINLATAYLMLIE